jgi:hypothetical protein
MTKRSKQLADYELMFNVLDDTLSTLDPELKIQIQGATEVAEEVEALRAITEQVNAEAAGLHLLTLG